MSVFDVEGIAGRQRPQRARDIDVLFVGQHRERQVEIEGTGKAEILHRQIDILNRRGLMIRAALLVHDDAVVDGQAVDVDGTEIFARRRDAA